MSYTLRKLPDEPIIVFTAAPNYDVREEIEFVVRDGIELYDASPEPVFLIVDFSDLPTMHLTDLMIGTERSARGADLPFHHPKVRQVVIVTRNPMIGAAAEAMNLTPTGTSMFRYLKISKKPWPMCAAS